MRNPALGLALAAALFSGSPDFPLVAAPCIISIFVQNTLGAWTALLGVIRQPARPRSESGQPLSPQAFRAQSLDSIMRQVRGAAGQDGVSERRRAKAPGL